MTTQTQTAEIEYESVYDDYNDEAKPQQRSIESIMSEVLSDQDAEILDAEDFDDDLISQDEYNERYSALLAEIEERDVEEYKFYQGEIAALNDIVDNISVVQSDLIKLHFDAGERLSNLREWYIRHFDTQKGWVDFVLSDLNYGYNIKTSQRDIRLWTRLSPYRDVFISSGNKGVTITALYLLSNPNKVSDEALDWIVDLVKMQAEADDNVIKMTKSKVEEIAATVQVIEKEVDEEKRDLLRGIVQEHGITNPETTRVIGRSPVERLQEYAATKHVEYIDLDDSGAYEQVNVPLSLAGKSDFEKSVNQELQEKRARQRQHIKDSMAQKEARERGTKSEQYTVLEAPVIQGDQAQRIEEFLQKNPDINSNMGQVMRAILKGQGTAGSRSIIYTVDFIDNNEAGHRPHA